MIYDVKSGDKESVMNLFKSIKNFDGVMGIYEYKDIGSDRYLYLPIHLKKIENQEITVIK
jgi:hypothetical protein